MKLVILGSGNVATHLALALNAIGEEIVQIWSPTAEHAFTLASRVSAQPISGYEQINPEADLYIISVKDDAIAGVAGKLGAVKGLVVHTSGATGIEVLSGQVQRAGVLYPLQTFSKVKSVDFESIPLCIEAVLESDFTILEKLAQRLSRKVFKINGEQRKALHLAAVFACNFTNHLYNLANQILEKNQLDFDIIRPLIAETADKIQFNLPQDVQTGPAVRNDIKTLSQHEDWLKSMPELHEIYQILSKSIKITHK